MTVVASFATMNEITLLADTRISGAAANGSVLFYHDVCQKLYIPNAWSVVGIAGDVCLARTVIQALCGRIARTDPSDTNWLRSNDFLQRLVSVAVNSHGRFRTVGAREQSRGARRIRQDHSLCRQRHFQVIIAWLDHSRDVLGRSTQDTASIGPRYLETIIIDSPSLIVRRRPLFGLSVIGSGDQALTSVTSDELTELSWFGMKSDYGRQQRAMMASIVVKDLLRKHRVASVGDAHQIAVLDRFGVSTVPYFYWADVAPGYGTYVAVRINRGEWCIEHRPTKVLIPIRTVMEFQAGHPDWKRRITKAFDPQKHLTVDSPGVVPETEWNLVHHVYDPEVIPDEIRASWGDQPLAPQQGPFKTMKPRRFRPI